MKSSPNEHAVFLCGDFALATNTYAAGMTYDLTYHVLSGLSFDTFHVGLASADGPLGDVIRPDVRCDRCRSLTITAKSQNSGFFELFPDSTSKKSGISNWCLARVPQRDLRKF